MPTQAKCITCPEFQRLRDGALAVMVEWRIDVGAVTVERLLRTNPNQPGEWETCEPESIVQRHSDAVDVQTASEGRPTAGTACVCH